MSEVTRILSAIEQGDPHAAEQLLPLVYDELRKLASQKLAQEKSGQTLQATALVHEAYVRLVDEEAKQKWNHRGWRRQQGGNGNGGEPPSREQFESLVDFLGREPTFERFFPSISRESVRDKATDHRSHGCHQGVVKPQLLVPRRQDNRCHVQGAGKRNERVVE